MPSTSVTRKCCYRCCSGGPRYVSETRKGFKKTLKILKMNKSYNCKITLATKKLEKQFISGDNFPGEEAISWKQFSGWDFSGPRLPLYCNYLAFGIIRRFPTWSKKSEKKLNILTL